MDVQEAKLREKLQGTGVSVTRNGDELILNMPNNVTFDSSSAQLKAAGANTLSGVAMVVAEFDKTRLNVVGHTDSTGSRELNMKLFPRSRRCRRRPADRSGRGGQPHRHQRCGPGSAGGHQQHRRGQGPEPPGDHHPTPTAWAARFAPIKRPRQSWRGLLLSRQGNLRRRRSAALPPCSLRGRGGLYAGSDRGCTRRIQASHWALKAPISAMSLR